MNGRLTVELRAFDSGTREFEAVAVTYGVTDSYRTRFMPGVFAESLRGELPPIRWGHDQSSRGLVGQIVDYVDNNLRLEIIGQIFPAGKTPHSRQAYEGLRHGVLDEFSVGFDRLATYKAPDGVVEITKAQLLEVSIVMNAAVPGAELITVRSRSEIAASYGPIARRLAAVEGARRPGRPRPVGVDERAADEVLAQFGLS